MNKCTTPKSTVCTELSCCAVICSDLCDETDLHQNNHFNKLLKLAKPIARVFFIINIFYIYRVRIQPEIASYYTNNCTFFKAFLSIQQVCYILCNVLSSKPSERFFYTQASLFIFLLNQNSGIGFHAQMNILI